MPPVQSTLRSINSSSGSFACCSFFVRRFVLPTITASRTQPVDPARQYILADVVEVEATDSKPAHEVLKVKCLLCDNISTWSSWVRVRGHLSGDGTLALAAGTVACTNVPQDVARKFKDIINATHEQKRQRDAEMRGRAAVDAAGASGGGGGGGGGSGAAAAANKRQKSIEAAFDTSHRAEMDEAVAKFFMGCDVSFQIVGHPLFKRMIDKAKTAGPSYKPPIRQRLSDDLLDTVEARVDSYKAPHLEAMKIYGGTIAADGATVHGEPIANFVTKVASMPKPVHLKILNAKKHIAEGGSKNADFMAEGLVTEIRLLPDGGIHVVLLIGDTASDEVLAARQVISVLPWISYAPRRVPPTSSRSFSS